MAAAGQLRPFARTREVWSVNRRAGLPAGVTMAELAEDYADGMSQWSRVPVDVLGVSTGGSVALQLAAVYPGLVRRLVRVVGLPAGAGGPPGPAGH